MIRVTKVQAANNVCHSGIPTLLCKELGIKKGDTLLWEWTKKSNQITITKVVEEDDEDDEKESI